MYAEVLTRYVPVDFSKARNNPELNKYIVLNYYAAIDRYGKAGLLPFPAADFTATMSGISTPLNAQGWGEVLAGLYAGFTGLTHEVEDIWAQGDQVQTRILATGTHTGTVLGAAASGNRLALPVAAVFTLHDNKITSIASYFDVDMLMSQLGVEPAYSFAK
jgi:predicted ester cyclase